MTESADNRAGGLNAATRIARFVEVLAAALLLGGLVATGAVAQIAFHSPEILSREQAGRLLAEVFERSIPIEAALVGAMAIGAVIARAPSRLAAALVLGGALVGSHFYLGGEMRALRVKHGGTTARLAPEDEDRRRFGMLHGVYSVVSLGLLGLGAGILGAHALRKES